MHNTFRRRLVLIVAAACASWVFLWYTHSLVDRLNNASRRNCETIARLWAGVQYPLSVVGDGSKILSCSRCGNPGGLVSEYGESESMFCSVCSESTLFIPTSRLLVEERHDLIVSTRRLFGDIASRLDFPTIFSDEIGYPQIADGVITDGFPADRIIELRKKMEMLALENLPVPLVVRGDTIGYLYYGSTDLNAEMKLIPFLELGLLLLIAAVLFLLLRSEIFREKDMSWVGFARETAHQISTPLSSLMGWLELLREDSSVMANMDTLEAVDHMSTDVKRLAGIAERYGQMGREPRLKPVSVEETIEETVGYFNMRKGLLGHGVILEMRGDCCGAMVMGNRVLLGWVLENLIKNAVAACAGSADGGRVAVECSKPAQNDQSVEILVSDNGNGIPYSDQGRIFNAGFTTRKGGWGLGLSLARRIIEEYHRGSIRLVSSLPGGGHCIQYYSTCPEGW